MGGFVFWGDSERAEENVRAASEHVHIWELWAMVKVVFGHSEEYAKNAKRNKDGNYIQFSWGVKHALSETILVALVEVILLLLGKEPPTCKRNDL